MASLKQEGLLHTINTFGPSDGRVSLTCTTYTPTACNYKNVSNKMTIASVSTVLI